MNWYHYSRHQIAALYSVQQGLPNMKPRGLWYAADGSWKTSSQSWNDSNAFDHRYQVVIAPEAKLLRIESQEAAEALARRIGVWNDVDQSYIRMRWSDIATEYDGLHVGVEYSYRDPASIAQWHYAFDVISGCVWNTDAIELIDCQTGETIPRGGIDPKETVEAIDLSKLHFRSEAILCRADGSAPRSIKIDSMTIGIGLHSLRQNFRGF